MSEFYAMKNGKKIKTFKAKNMNTVYNQFNKYCREKGHTIKLQTQDSFGFVAWSNGQENITLHQVGGM